ncbi:stage II sporulation protein M, partial [Bacteroides heparinolyticus]|uniref:stage II sporulation protein M n=1 Tax=Prevotella heparinolytica TaxID=28113 RepID=UPI0035A0D12F
NGMQFSIAHTLPHSFELVPLIFSAADGMFLGINIGLNLVLENKKKIEWRFYFKRLFLYLILIILAAFCEVFISMKL